MEIQLEDREIALLVSILRERHASYTLSFERANRSSERARLDGICKALGSILAALNDAR